MGLKNIFRRENEKLCLCDYKDIQTKFCFMDETGLLHSNRDKFFAIGLIECSNPEKLYRRIRIIRDKFNYRREVKWTNLDRMVRFEVAMEFFNVFVEEEAKFNCIILNKEELDFEKYFQNNLYKAYKNFSINLLKLVLGRDPNGVSVVLSDNYFFPEAEDFEGSVKRISNDHYKKFVVAGICQIDSMSSDILQITDLILGAIVYDLKKQNGLVEKQNQFKRKFLNFLYQKLKIQGSFFINYEGHKTRNFVLCGDKIRATVFDPKRSIVSKKNCVK
ncbi:MAG: DUF3800 domain-containing protein [Patescibacteria group bacterium]